MTRSKKAREYRDAARAKTGELVGGLIPMVRWYDGAWSFLLSLTDGVWIFSAQLFPQGRGSVEDDWKLLGLWAAAVGAPSGALVGDTIQTAPNAVHKWIWSDG